MSESSRKFICRFAFVGLCLVPLCGTLGYAAWQRWTMFQLRHGDWLAARLGVDVALEGLRESRPGVIETPAIRLLDPETGALLVHCQAVRILRGPHATIISSDSIDIPHKQCGPLWQLLDDRLLRQARGLPHMLVVTTPRLTVQHPDGGLETVGWRMECRSVEQTRRADITFRHARDTAETRVTRITLTRDLSRTQPATQIEVNAPDAAIDAALLSGSAAWLSPLGDDVRFRGVGWLRITTSGWNGELTGMVSGIDLERIASAWLPHAVTGLATLELQHAEVADSRIQSLKGILTAEGGRISIGLLKTLHDLGLQLPENIRRGSHDLDQMVAIEQLAILVQISQSGISLHGLCDASAEGTLIRTSRGPLAWNDIDHPPRSSAELIQAVVRANLPDALFTRTGEALWRLMPLSSN